MTEKQTLSTKCFELIAGSILNGEFLPGERLLTEELKKRYDVGMSPIREALSKLAGTRLVTFEEHKGFSVAKMSASQILDDINTFVEIECLCLKHSIEKGDDLWEERVIATLHSLGKVENGKEIEYSAWAPQNIRFHDALVSSCPLHSLLEIRNQLYQRHQWYIALSYKFADHAIFRANHLEHKKIGEAALARKADEALRLMRHHITAGIDDLIQKLKIKELIC